MAHGLFKSKRSLWALGLLSLLCLALAGSVVFAGRRVPSFRQVRASYKSSDAWIVDRNGEPLDAIRIASSHRTLDWVSWSEISPSFRELLISTEDQRFYQHPGVDPLALAHALVTQNQSRRGASTLTMQLANLIAKSRSSTYHRKFQQIFEALRLDFYWSKTQIAEAYVNLVPFRGELVGLRAAALGLFGKSPASLDRIESSLLVAMIRSPNAPLDLVAKRACRITEPKGRCNETDERVRAALTAAYSLSRARDLLPVLSSRVIQKNKTSETLIQTTLDRFIQVRAMAAVREQLRELQGKNVGDAAALVLSTRTGEVLAYVANGGRGFSKALQIDGVNMRRQAGSTLKPFVYGTAFDLNLLNRTSLVEDSPEDLAVGGGGVYSPKNYDLSFRGFVAAGEALGSSLNVPAVRTVELVRESRVLEKMEALGFTQLLSDDQYGPSLALGTVDVNLFELTNAYRQLSLYSGSKVFSIKTKEDLFASLSLPDYRRFTFGTDSLLSLPFPAAVKTGTSKDMRDNWCVGYTSEFTVGVWVGNFDGQPMWNVSGLTGAAPIWRELMLSLHANRKTQDAWLQYEAPAQPLTHRAITRIRYPQSGMLIGFDPDIPRTKQKLPIQIESPQASHLIYLDGRKLSRARETVFWDLKKGRHQVELKTSDGRRLDDVSFVVR